MVICRNNKNQGLDRLKIATDLSRVIMRDGPPLLKLGHGEEPGSNWARPNDGNPRILLREALSLREWRLVGGETVVGNA